MLHHRRQRHGERTLEFADRRRPFRETLDDRPAGRISESLERQVERGLIVKHTLNYHGNNRKASALVWSESQCTTRPSFGRHAAFEETRGSKRGSARNRPRLPEAPAASAEGQGGRQGVRGKATAPRCRRGARGVA